MLRNFILVGLGGALGSMARYWVGLLLPYSPNLAGLPWATLVVNILGSLVVGAVAGANQLGGALYNTAFRVDLFVVTGFAGGFTTFSAFSAQTMNLLQSGEAATAFVYVVLSLAAGLLAIAAGYALGLML